MKKAIRYSIILCAISWLCAALLYFVIGVESIKDPLYVPFASLYMLLPMLCALVLEYFERDKTQRLKLVSFKINKHWLLAILLPFVITSLVAIFDYYVAGVELKTGTLMPQEALDSLGNESMAKTLSKPSNVIIFIVIQSIFAGCTLNALFAFGEEYGWRKYLVEALKDKNFVVAALFIGFVWGIWHFPMILMGHNYGDHNIEGIFMMILFCIVLGILELYITLKTRSVVAAAILHGTINAIAGLPSIIFNDLNPITESVPGLVGNGVMIIVIALLFLYDKHISKDNIMSQTLAQYFNSKYTSADE